LALNLLFLVVLLAYSVTFFVINQMWQPGNLPQGAMHTRMAWQQIVDNIAFAAQLWGMLLCTVPFGMIDSTSSVSPCGTLAAGESFFSFLWQGCKYTGK